MTWEPDTPPRPVTPSMPDLPSSGKGFSPPLPTGSTAGSSLASALAPRVTTARVAAIGGLLLSFTVLGMLLALVALGLSASAQRQIEDSMGRLHGAEQLPLIRVLAVVAFAISAVVLLVSWVTSAGR